MILLSFIYTFSKRSHRLLFIFQNALNLSIAFLIFMRECSFSITLVNLFGIHLVLDEVSRYFILLTALVFMGVSFRGVNDRNLTFLLSVTMFSLNLLFLSYDLFNLYVMIELVSLLTFLLIVHGKKISQYWAALKYIILGTFGMNLYLVGVAIVYRFNYSLSVQDVKDVPLIASSLMIVGIMIRSGVFLFSMWLPQAHAEAETVVSAVLSGVVVKTGVYALLRIIPVSNRENIVSHFGAISAVLGVVFAFLSDDYKKILSYSTLSQVGIILSSFKTAPLYSLAHGIFKSWLFLLKDDLPTRKVKEIKKLDFTSWLFLILASLSISGLPGTSGYVKGQVIEHVPLISKILLEIAFVGTCASFAKFLFMKVGGAESKKIYHHIFLLTVSTILGVLFFNEKYIFSSILIFLIGISVHLIAHGKCKLKKIVLEDLEVSLPILVILTVVISWLMYLQR